MKYVKLLLLATLFVILGLVTLRYYRQHRDRALALPVIADLGGKVGSLPFEPIGTEYYVSFRNRIFARADLDRLMAIQPLARRNTVTLHFHECGLTLDEVLYLKRIVPSARITQFTDKDRVADKSDEPEPSGL